MWVRSGKALLSVKAGSRLGYMLGNTQVQIKDTGFMVTVSSCRSVIHGLPPILHMAFVDAIFWNTLTLLLCIATFQISLESPMLPNPPKTLQMDNAKKTRGLEIAFLWWVSNSFIISSFHQWWVCIKVFLGKCTSEQSVRGHGFLCAATVSCRYGRWSRGLDCWSATGNCPPTN